MLKLITHIIKSINEYYCEEPCIEGIIEQYVNNFLLDLTEDERSRRRSSIAGYYNAILKRSGSTIVASKRTAEWARKIYPR